MYGKTAMIILKILGTNTQGLVTWVNRCYMICALLSS